MTELKDKDMTFIKVEHSGAWTIGRPVLDGCKHRVDGRCTDDPIELQARLVAAAEAQAQTHTFSSQPSSYHQADALNPLVFLGTGICLGVAATLTAVNLTVFRKRRAP